MCDCVGDPPTVATKGPGRTFVELLPEGTPPVEP